MTAIMEPTVLVPLLSLLILKLGYADHASPVSAREVPEGPVGADVLGLNQNQNHSIQAWKSSDTHSNSSGSSSLSNNATMEMKNSSGPLQPADYNVTDVETTDVSDRNESSTIQTLLHPSVVPSNSSHTPPSPNPGVAYTASNPTVSATLPTNNDTSNHSEALDHVALTTSKPPSQTETASTPPTTELKVSSTSPGSSHEPSGSPLSVTSSSRHPEASSKAQLKPTAQSDTSTQTGRPAQLNVGGGTVTTHKTPTLDPLLAGLVSAFILTAVVITLLLFFKLRRRDSRPEFRRLQDLPMDDMMEDTPLSMYSY